MAEVVKKEGEKDSLFERLYKGTKEVFDAIKMPLIKRALKRKMAEAVDSAKSQKLDAELSLTKLQEDIQNYDLNKYLQLTAKIESADKTITVLSEHYKELFDEELT